MEIFRGYDGKDLYVRSFYDMRVMGDVLPVIENERKSLEVRIAYPGIRQIGVGTVIRYNRFDHLKRRVLRATSYETFEEVLRCEDPKKIYPSLSANHQIALFRIMHDPRDEMQYGIRVFELAHIR